MSGRLCFSLVALVLLGSMALPLGGKAVAGTYVVQYGDTLWDLGMRFYRDYEYWKVIWEANPAIENPHWIYPGDVLLIPAYGGSVQTASFSTSTVTSSEAIIPRLRVETAGMVAVDPLVPQGYIVDVDAEEEHAIADENMYTGDLVHIDIGTNHGYDLDSVFHVLKRCEAIYHPNSGEYIGDMIRVAGVCRIVQPGAESSVALIEHSYQPIELGDILVDYTAATAVTVNTESVLPSLTAWVIGIQDQDMDDAYVAEVIYLDKGSSNDLSPGDIFWAYRYGDVQSSPGDDSVLTLDVPIAEVVVVSTESTTCSALVSGNVTGDLLRVGDQLHLVRRQQS